MSSESRVTPFLTWRWLVGILVIVMMAIATGWVNSMENLKAEVAATRVENARLELKVDYLITTQAEMKETLKRIEHAK